MTLVMVTFISAEMCLKTCWRVSLAVWMSCPLNATCPSLGSLSHLEVTGAKVYLVRRTQPYVVGMDGFVTMCPLSSALGVELGTSWLEFMWCRNKRTGGVCAKGFTSTSFKMLMLPRASWGCSVMCNKLLLYGFVSSCELKTVFKEQEVVYL